MRGFRTIAEAAALLFALSLPAFAQITQVRHIIIIVQENRTPDNLFHGLTLPGADIANSGLDSKGQTITLQKIALDNSYDLSHKHNAFLEMYDGGKMDGANLIACRPKQDCPKFPQYRYVDPSNVVPYFEIATNYGFANRMFETNQGPSFPSHQFFLSGTSAPSTTSLDFAAEEPNLKSTVYGNGCIADSQQSVPLIDPSGSEGTALYPCYEHPTLTDLLDGAGVSWRYYTALLGEGGWIWTGPLAMSHMCVSSGPGGACTGTDFSGEKVFFGPAQILTDIQNGELANVSWVIPDAGESDHPEINNGSGPSWVSSVVNAVGESPYWDSSVIFITWDDWGGWYDHVAPPIDPTYGYYEYGFRVPLLVVSPYTPQGTVSNTVLDVGSLLKFVEETFDLPSIQSLDPSINTNYADERANAPSDFFDFSAPPRPFVAISAAKTHLSQ